MISQKITNWLKTYANRRMLVVFMLGFSSGLPLALVGGTLQAWFKTDGANILMIGFMTLIAQPYSYKFFWAPLLDKYAPTKFLDRRRGWLLFMQLAIISVIVAMSCFKPHATLFNIPILLILGFVLSACSATQDIAIDAYRVEVLKSDERGLGAALGVEGYRVAMIASGGFALFLADAYGWQATYLIMALLMTIGIIATSIAPAVLQPTELEKTNLLAVTVNSFKDFLKRKNAWLLLILIVIYKLSDAFAHALSTTFLLDLSFTLSEVGVINKLVGMAATLLGIMVGGLFMTRVGLFKALMTFGILSAVTNLFYMFLAVTGKNMILASTGVFIENICAGMGTAAFVALIMSLCSSKYTATQFALFSSLAALGRIYVGPVSGYMVKTFGWANFYLFTAIVAIPSVLLLIFLKPTIEKRDMNPKTQLEENEAPDEKSSVSVAS